MKNEGHVSTRRKNMTYETPVAFFIFDRPHETKRVFEAVRRARPKRLFVIADGPKASMPDQTSRCTQTRKVIEQVDWDCDLATNFADTNLGCKQRITSGLDWVFERVDRAIVLEDDCLPNMSFFAFCDDLLERFARDPRIMSISGDNFLRGRRRSSDSYYFSVFFHCWGWATWRRAWSCYDGEMRQWPAIREGGWLSDVLGNRGGVRYWTRLFNLTYQGKVDSWAYAFLFSCWANSALAVHPSTNLVSNIGFAETATHTLSVGPLSNLPTRTVTFPLRHPKWVIADVDADRLTQNEIYDPPARRSIRALRKALAMPKPTLVQWLGRWRTRIDRTSTPASKRYQAFSVHARHWFSAADRRKQDRILRTVRRRVIRMVAKRVGLGAAYSLTERGTLFERGWFASVKDGRPIDANGDPIPRWTYAAIDFVGPRLEADHTVFEFGCGNSTRWLAKKVGRVYGVEHDSEWVRFLEPLLPSNARIQHRALHRGYVDEIERVGVRFDVIVIDGRRRVESAAVASNCLTDRGAIIWDNADRTEYDPGYRVLEERGFHRIDFRSMGPIVDYEWTTSVFYREGNCLGV